MSEHWPPHRDDPAAAGPGSGQPDAVQQPDARQLAEVTSALASAPMPALPDVFKARISAAIAAQAATRTEQARAAGVSATARSSSSSSSGSFPRARSRRAGARRGPRRPGAPRAPGPAGPRPVRRGLVSVRGIGSLVACLVLAGFGYLVIHGGARSGPAATSAASAASSAASAAAAAPAARGAAGGAANAPLPAGGEHKGHFAVRETGTRYQPSTLAGQVRAALAATGAGSSPRAATGSGALVAGGVLPSATLAGCVGRLTGGVTPSLVDRASYAGRPAYVIAVPSRAWVVRLGCTAANPELIATVALAG